MVRVPIPFDQERNVPYRYFIYVRLIPPTMLLMNGNGCAFMIQLTNEFTKCRCKALPWAEGVCMGIIDAMMGISIIAIVLPFEVHLLALTSLL